MEQGRVLILVLSFLLSVTIYGQAGADIKDIEKAVCIYNNRSALETYASPFIVEDALASTSGISFELTVLEDKDEDLFTVTLIPVNIGESIIIGLAVQAFEKNDGSMQGTPLGLWHQVDDVMVKTCESTNNTAYEDHSAEKVAKMEYLLKWSPVDVPVAVHEIVFSATTLVFIGDGTNSYRAVYFFGIRSRPFNIIETRTTPGKTMTIPASPEETRTTPGKTTTIPASPEDGSRRQAVPIFAIIIGASVFLVVLLVVVLSLYCACVVKNNRRHKEIDLVEMPAPNQNGQGNANPALTVETKHNDEVAELPKIEQKSQKLRKLSDLIEQELEEEAVASGRNRSDEHRTGTIEIERSHVLLKEQIGEGAFAEVFKAEAFGLSKTGLITVAVKKFKDPKMADSDFKKELKVLMTFQPHPNIIQLMGACTEKEPYFLVLEYAEMGDLRAYLHKQRKSLGMKILEPKKLMTFAVQIATGMEYIEGKECVHRDLATRNVLLGNGLVCKLSDFGLARNVDHKSQYIMHSDAPVPVRWMAPECIKDNLFTYKSDVWSFGVLCWELVTMAKSEINSPTHFLRVFPVPCVLGYRLGYNVTCKTMHVSGTVSLAEHNFKPWALLTVYLAGLALKSKGSYPYGGYKTTDVIKKITKGEHLEKPEHCSTELYDVIMTACWQKNPSKRPGFTNLRSSLQLMLANAESNIVAKSFSTKGYVYLKPENWDNSKEDEPRPPMAAQKNRRKRHNIPDKLEFQCSVEQH